MLKIILILLLLTFQSLAEDSKKQLPPCKGDYWTNCFGEYSASEATYTGEWLENKFHGLGKYIWADRTMASEKLCMMVMVV